MHLGPLSHSDLNLSREIAPLPGCWEVGLGPLPAAALPHPSTRDVGLLQTRLCALEAEPDSWSGSRLGGFFCSPPPTDDCGEVDLS